MTTSIFPAWLLRSKVSPTRQRVDLLERLWLTQMLHRSLPGKLSLVNAPAGYGKTTLLGDWRRLLLEEGHKVCWLSLDSQDNEASQLLAYIAFAIHEGGVQISAKDAGLSVHINDLSEREVLSLIIHSIAETSGNVVLILDEFESLGAEVVDKVIHPILEYAPNNLHISIASRTDAALRISRLEARGQASRLDATKLAFTAADLKTILADRCDPSTIQHLFALTQGWPVAIQMIRSACDVEATVAHMLSDAAFVANRLAHYLTDEVLRGIDQDSYCFLMDISLVEQVDCEFADYLRERNDSHSLFQSLNALDAFVQPVDSVRLAFRLHPLFREHLFKKFSMTNPVRVKSLQLRAAEWFFGTGDLVEAVRRCMLAGEPATASALFSKAGGVLIWFKEGITRLAAITRLLNDGIVNQDVNWQLIRCLLDMKAGRIGAARKTIDSIAARGDFADLHAGTSSSRGMPAALIIEMVVSIVEGKTAPQLVCNQLEALLSAPTDNDTNLNGLLLTILCHGAMQRGHFMEAQRFAEMADFAFANAGAVYGTAYNHFHLGCIAFARGDIPEAERRYKMGQQLSKKYFGDDHGLRLIANILISELKYERSEPQGMTLTEKASPQLLENHETWFGIVAAGYTSFVGYAFDEQGIDAALAIIDGGMKYARLNNLRVHEDFLTLLRIELFLRAGRIVEARTLVTQFRFDNDERMSSEEEIGWRQRDATIQVIARLMIAEGESRQALDLLGRHSARQDESRHIKSRIRHLLLHVIAHRQLGELPEMIRHLDGALALSVQTGCIRAFLNERELLQSALEAYMPLHDQPAASTANLQQAQLILKLLSNAPTPTAAESLLSRTETRVLQELSSGFSNKLIARKIGVSESTVRFHLRNIFQKLKVRSRLEAVTIARQQNLLAV